MKVVSPDLQNADGVHARRTGKASDSKKGKAESSASRVKSGGNDRVQISSAGEQMKTLRARLKELPDIRVERVQELKTQIESGSYNPPAEEIADAMLQSIQKYS